MDRQPRGTGTPPGRTTGWPVIGRQRTRATAPDGRFTPQRNATGHGEVEQPPPAPAPAGPGGSGRGLVWLVLAVVAVVVLATVWLLDYGRLDPLADRGAAAPPSALPPFGSYVDARVRPGGTVEVSQWVRATEPIRTVRLEAMPAPPGTGGRPVASRLRLVANGTELGGPHRLDGPQTYRLTAPARVVHAVYRLEGVAQPSSTPGVRLAVTSLFLRLRVDPRGTVAGPKRVDVVGPGLVGARCVPTIGLPVPRSCGAAVKGSPDTVRVELRGGRRTDRVAALLGDGSAGTG